MTIERRNAPRLLLAALRSVGAGAFAVPHVGAKSLGLPEDAESSYILRLFAARNIAMIAGLLASDGKSRRVWWQTGIACDVLDAGAGLMGLREGKPRRSAMVDTGASLAAAALGVAGLIADRS